MSKVVSIILISLFKSSLCADRDADWLHLTLQNLSLNSGDDIAGTVHALGSRVAKTKEFAIGDRVAAFHPMMGAHGAFAEFAIAPYHTIFKIPDGTSFEGRSYHLFSPAGVDICYIVF